ncbi:hypothetical protein IEQ34_015705 [Dendrobium chrysotoxum]|uniref:GPI mannosyltransferase I n=1 Tax=Dendrobium chrysotoxum TaxID=161865 RepID=A0AAV7GJP7_DENCH|nr:hypothetical protein IEQ34_015705 [Dendrobium chrysotoxum]
MGLVNLSRMLLFSAIIRLFLLIYGEWQDAHMEVRYTDVDYLVFSDAAAMVAAGRSPFERSTYRYSPLLAFFLVPNCFLHRSWGKILFSTSGMYPNGRFFLFFVLHLIIFECFEDVNEEAENLNADRNAIQNFENQTHQDPHKIHSPQPEKIDKPTPHSLSLKVIPILHIKNSLKLLLNLLLIHHNINVKIGLLYRINYLGYSWNICAHLLSACMKVADPVAWRWDFIWEFVRLLSARMSVADPVAWRWDYIWGFVRLLSARIGVADSVACCSSFWTELFPALHR